MGKVPSHLELQEVEKIVEELEGIQPKPHPDVDVLHDQGHNLPTFLPKPSVGARRCIPLPNDDAQHRGGTMGTFEQP